MAKKNDAVAQRERRQKIFVAIGGVVLIALLAIQGPKVLKQVNGSGAAAPAETTEMPTTSAPTPAGTGSTPAPATGKSSAILVGVPVTPSGNPAPEEGQLSSFSRFEAKDPFEPNVSAEEAAPASAKAPTGSYGPRAQTKQAPATATETHASAVGGAVAPAAPTPAVPTGTSPAAQPVTNATIAVNGKSEQVVVKDHFPKPDRTFVLVGLTDGAAKVGVAGGSFTDGATVALKIGKQVTLVDTATGARYVLKLLYLGADPEQVESFSTKSPDE